MHFVEVAYFILETKCIAERITFCLAIYFIDKTYFITYSITFSRQMQVVNYPVSCF